MKNGHLILVLLLAAVPAAAQESKPGPLTPTTPPKVVRVPVKPTPEPPPIPVEELIRRVAAKEEELLRLRAGYAYRVAVRVQEYDESGAAAGTFELTGEVVADAAGRKSLRVTEQPPSTLRRTTFEIADVEGILALPLFPLTAHELEHYEVTYVGRQPLDELNTYILRVQPKKLDRRRRFFEGAVWVDERDFAVVRSNGRFVSEVDEEGATALFAMQEVYRENLSTGVWLPTYLNSEDRLKSEQGEARLRLVIRFTDYKPMRTQPPKPGS